MQDDRADILSCCAPDLPLLSVEGETPEEVLEADVVIDKLQCLSEIRDGTNQLGLPIVVRVVDERKAALERERIFPRKSTAPRITTNGV